MQDKPIVLRMFDPDKDYSVVSAWWLGHGWDAVPLVMLPKLGAIAEIGDKPLAAGWLYMDNSCPVCMLEWLVTDHKCTGIKTAKALHRICDFMSIHAKELGYAAMLTTCKQESLVRFHTKRGFTRTDSNMTHFVKSL